MRSWTIAWLIGCLALHSLPSIPSIPWAALSTAVAIAAVLSRRGRLPLLAVLGFLWTGWAVADVLAARAASDSLPRDVVAEGRVVGIPQEHRRRTRFSFEVSRVQVNATWHAHSGRWRVDWYSPDKRVISDSRWRLGVRLGRRRTPRNPGEFDVEAFHFRNRITATGWVRGSAERTELSPRTSIRIDPIRQKLSQSIRAFLHGRWEAGLVAALGVGDRQAIGLAEAGILRETGTAHLMAISGLHVGIVAALGLLVGSSVWRRVPYLVSKLPARSAGVIVGFLLAIIYAALAGFALPTQRALIMLSIVSGALLLKRPAAPSRVLLVSLWIVIVLDPLAPLGPGFWLSFGAVACILWMCVGRSGNGLPLAVWVRIQGGLTLLMAPIGALFFGAMTPAGFIANLVAVPWVSVAVVPPTLLGTALMASALPGGDVALRLAAGGLAWLWPYLEWVAKASTGILVPAPTHLAVILGVGGVFLLLVAGLPGRLLGILLLLPLFGSAWSFADHTRVTVLDAGQVSPVVVSHGHNAVVIDTGVRGRGGFDPGRAVVVPFLQDQGRRSLDAVILTSADVKRTGGLRALRESIQIGHVIGPAAGVAAVRGLESCAAGESIRFGVIRVRFMATGAAPTHCAAWIETPGATVFVPGHGASGPAAWSLTRIPDLVVLNDRDLSDLPDASRPVLDRVDAAVITGSGSVRTSAATYRTAKCGAVEWWRAQDGEGGVHCFIEENGRYWRDTGIARTP